MRSIHMLTVLSAVITLAACRPEDLEDTPLVADACGSEGARIEMDLDGDNWCATASVLAVASAEGDLVVTGVSLSGSIFTIEVDSLAEGSFIIDEADNAALWMEAGVPYISTNDDPGTLVVLWHDAAQHRASGTFEVTLHDAENPASRTLNGSFDVTYTVE